MVLQCGAAVRDITPSHPVSLHGYAARNRFSEETPSSPDAPSEPIVLGCLCLDDGAQRVLIVTADMVGISSSVCAELYSLLHEAVGITFPNVLLSCSHTHFAPALQVADCHPLPGPLGNEPDPRFVADFQRKLVEAAKEAVEMLQPVTMETARVRAGALSYNRRWRTTDGKVTMHLQYPFLGQAAQRRPYASGQQCAGRRHAHCVAIPSSSSSNLRPTANDCRGVAQLGMPPSDGRSRPGRRP